ncbi:MAG TPA: glycosyltransferase family 4 protein, partial [Tepidisphaeraceae bacterium]
KRGVEVWLCVHERCRKELTELLGPDIDRVTFAPDTWKHRLLWKIGKPMPEQLRISTTGALSQLITQRWQKHIMKLLVPRNMIDVVHQPIPISPKQPTAIDRVGVPVVIGPLNGDINYPPAFRHMESASVRLTVAFGRGLGAIANWLIPGKLNAKVILVSNERTAKALPKGIKGRVVHLVANAVDLNTWDAAPARDPNAAPRFAFLGRLVDFKMIDLLLEAFAPIAREFNARLDIIGEGDQRPKLEKIAADLKITPNVHFAGWMKYKEAAALMAHADAMVFPSLRECGGAVVMEAMATGLPVIAADWGGPADYVGTEADGAGMLIQPDTKESFITGLTAAMRRLAESSELRRQMSENARKRAVDHFQWDSRVDALLDVYRSVVT